MKRIRQAILLVLLIISGGALQAQTGESKLKRIYFNLYTDSIKTVLNYYVNIEGEYSNGRILPMDAGTVRIIADHGTMSGNEWVAPKIIDFDKVTFHAIVIGDPRINDRVTVWLKRGKDPRDDLNGEDMDLPVVPEDTRKRRR